jgi:hypothetical protein
MIPTAFAISTGVAVYCFWASQSHNLIPAASAGLLAECRCGKGYVDDPPAVLQQETGIGHGQDLSHQELDIRY